MPAPHQFLSMILQQQLGPQRLQRQPEQASQVTDQPDHVLAYDRVMSTKLVAAYAGALSVIHRARPIAPAPDADAPNGDAPHAADLACGPGHFTLCLARYLDYRRVTGFDLSEPMLEAARANAAADDTQTNFTFRQGDITNLADVEPATFALTCCTDAAHHLPDLDHVRRLCLEMDRITQPTGLVVLMDLARLRTAGLTRKYLQVLGEDYKQRGLTSFYNDFHDSMHAAWTTAELHEAIPRTTRRWWCHLVPRGLPTVQIVLGLPVGRRQPFVRLGYPSGQNPLVADWYPRWQQEVGERWARETRSDCRLVELGLATAGRRYVPPADAGKAEG